MDTNVLATIRQLSLIDEKTLTQKALKLCEETGELAKVVLPYENAFATTHRFVTANRILEEVADTLLCSLSIAYDLGFTDDDIRDAMIEKSIKWSKLQQSSIKGKFPLPFEIHITVKLASNILVDNFKLACARIGVKPIVLDIGMRGALDVMTSSVIMTDNLGAYNEMRRISQELTDAGFDVIRDKIETVPWHPAAPTEPKDVNPNLYFECHINVVCNEEERERLVKWNEECKIGGHLSRNVFKRINDEDFIQMLTIRSTTVNTSFPIDTAGDFVQYVEMVIETLNGDENNYLPNLRPNAVLKHTIEYAIYDTNVSHDTGWVTKL